MSTTPEPFEDLPETTREEVVEIVDSLGTRATPSIFLETAQGREALRRLYLEDKPSKDLAFIFGTSADHVRRLATKHGWDRELRASKETGELARQRAALRAQADELKLGILKAVSKGVDTLNSPDYTGEMVVENAVKVRALTQSVNDISPAEDKNPAAPQTLINHGLIIS